MKCIFQEFHARTVPCKAPPWLDQKQQGDTKLWHFTQIFCVEDSAKIPSPVCGFSVFPNFWEAPTVLGKVCGIPWIWCSVLHFQGIWGNGNWWKRVILLGRVSQHETKKLWETFWNRIVNWKHGQIRQTIFFMSGCVCFAGGFYQSLTSNLYYIYISLGIQSPSENGNGT